MVGGSPKHHLAIYPGSFDPVTLGHLDVLSRARRLFDEVIIAVGRNPDKPDFFPVEERVALLEPLIEEIMRREPDAARAYPPCMTTGTQDANGTTLKQRYLDVQSRIASAAKVAGRRPEDIMLVVVSKSNN